ncbi:UDP-N-acetylmuramate dehydrogenase [Larkinella terrae]|uniref:UDP-N-acetylenolpyruvoylglucosamine reductase n=1 Tax=Larkinella terrae TaxID=2025311 RepID=A0A7K0EGK7_9BACT|nr:UDP-N-acetylmuramate dehydrogenase [Larkinella terrae]MRS60979.1 UDP-N-acetylmuramate dehydrogenase [Larkinella terrae]
MLDIQSHVSLKSYNTFGFDAKARYWVEIDTDAQLQTLFQLTEFLAVPKLILGGGSNLLFTRDFEGLVIKMSIQGIEVLREDASHVFVKAGAGVNWHQLVLFCVQNGYAGIENLSLIPGTTGAAPMQNIGAYGVEIEQVFDHLEAVDIRTGETRIFNHAECRFGYRESVFKHEAKGQYIISNVTFRLNKQPVFHIDYGAIRETLATMGISEDKLSIKAISDAVIRIRRSKLPNPAEIGNAGSFFKNPEISKDQFETLKTEYPAMPGFPTGDLTMKVPAGWLIEQCGWKGKHVGNAGVHSKQALVLVNHGGATGSEILSLASKVQQSVEDKFGIRLNPEVNIV